MWTHIYSNYPDVFRISNHFAFIQSICQVHDVDWYIVWYIVVFVYSSVDLTSLWRAARRRISHAYRPGTKANQRSQIKSYLSFCISHGLEYRNPSVDTLCVYAEYLAHKLTSPKSVKNYLGAVQLYHNYIGLEAPNLSHFRYILMLRALPLTMRHFPSQKLPVTPEILDQICAVCDQIGATGIVLKVAFTLTYYGLLRQSNTAPASRTGFDPSRHSTRGDVTLSPPGLVVQLKWSKTHQAPGTPALVPIASVPGQRTDPVAAYTSMLRAVPTRSPADPLLTLPSRRPVTSRYLQRALRCILTALGLHAHAYSLHSFRRGGATTAFREGADFIDVKRHGLWRSDAFWDYVADRQVSDSAVATALCNVMQRTATN